MAGWLASRRPFGGGKSGEWVINSDGSGYWSRLDSSAVRFRPLRPCGPKREEVVKRVTWDTRTGEMVGSPMLDYATSSSLAAELPEPRPRSIRTEFHFLRSSCIPAAVRPSLVPDVPHGVSPSSLRAVGSAGCVQPSATALGLGGPLRFERVD